MRCPDCNKFVSYDEPEVEATVDDVVSTVDGEVTVSVSVDIALNCAECGTELKRASLSGDCEVKFPDDLKPCSDEDGHMWECDEVDAEGSSRSEGKGWAKTFYGASLTGEVKCPHCDQTGEVTGTVEEQASAFDESV